MRFLCVPEDFIAASRRFLPNKGPMNRRHFIGGAASFAALMSLGRLGALGQQSLQHEAAAGSRTALRGDFKLLRRNVGTFTSRGGTIGWLVSPAGIAAVDTQFPDTAEVFLDTLPARAGRHLDFTINTHHHGDHTGGNPVLSKVSTAVVAQRGVPLLQMRAAERAGNLHKQVFAKTLFDESWSQDLGDERVRAFYLGAAHTGADAVVHFEQANVFHLGDLVFNRIYPVMDRRGGCVVKNWILVLERLLRECPKDALFIFGHGRPGFGVSGVHEDLGVMRDYLSALVEAVERGIKEGKTREQLCTQVNMPGFADFHVPEGKGNRFASNLSAVYDELTSGV